MWWWQHTPLHTHTTRSTHPTFSDGDGHLTLSDGDSDGGVSTCGDNDGGVNTVVVAVHPTLHTPQTPHSPHSVMVMVIVVVMV